MELSIANSLGFAVDGDHPSPMMVVARGSNGEDHWIESATRGLACQCTCFTCARPLVARQGKQRQWSFAHSSNSNCAGGVETQAHRFAKAVINEAGSLYIASTDANGWGKIHPKPWPIAPVRFEERIGGFRADLVGSLGNRELIIEIKVTHGCEQQKIDQYRHLGLSVLEIDLGPYRYKADNDLRDAILKTARRYWLSLSRERQVPQPPQRVPTKADKTGRLKRPTHISEQQWASMDALAKVNAFDPDGTLAIRNRRHFR